MTEKRNPALPDPILAQANMAADKKWFY